jgi:aminoglycoside phosphotransferase (APT) family kinase protein
MDEATSGRTEDSQHAELTAGLAGIVAGALDEPVVGVVNLCRLSGGSSRETWSFDVRAEDGRLYPMILQRDRSVSTEIFGNGVATEAEVLRAASEAGVPVPRVAASSTQCDLLGGPYVLVERIAGEAIPQRILRDAQFADARCRLASQYGETLGRIQQVPLARLPALADEHPLQRYRRLLTESGHLHPALEVAFRWLEANRPGPGDQVLVHGDFRNGNGIVGPDGLRAVIDWELAHLGDPMEDLGWFCLRAFRFGHALPVGGFGEYRELIQAYRSVTGRTVDAETLRWWMVLGTVRWGLVCVLRTVQHLSGVARSLELAAIGRRVCEAEYDLLLLLP